MRTRSEYRMSPIQVAPASFALTTVHPVEQQRDALGGLMLDAYRNTIDDEGESLGDAISVVDHYLAVIIRPYSYVVLEGPDPVAFAFVLLLDGLHYIDPVVVASTHKRRGIGSAVVRLCLDSLVDAGVTRAGATITDGNLASERLFAELGFDRHGSWS